MTRIVGRRDRLVGAVCLVLCPAVSGIFLGLVALLCVYPSDGGHALGVGALVAVGGFAVNAMAICLAAVAAEGHARRRARRAAHEIAELVAAGRI
jgi:hypothetical protein